MACPGQPVGSYSTEYIQVLTGLQPIRRRPGMYIGSADVRGLHHLLFSLIIESLAEATAGRGREVRVSLREDGSAEVSDDGRPMANVEVAFGHTSYSPRGDADQYRTMSGLHSSDFSVVNALSERLSVIARTDGSTYQHIWHRGVTHAAVQMGGPPNALGLSVTFKPDPEIFGDATFDATEVRDRLQQLAYLHSGVRITFTDEAAGTHDEFEYADGIREYVAFLNADREPLHPDVIRLRGEEQGVRYDVGLQWCASDEEIRRSFATHYFTPQGGTHDDGLRAGVAAGLHDFISEHAPQSADLRGEYLRVGLTSVVSVWLAEPMFESQIRARLNNPEVEGIVKAAVRRGVCEYFENNCGAAELVIRAALADRANHEAMRAERKKKRGG